MENTEHQVVRRVAVVGCGVSGLAAIKSCLEEGLEPCCFEMDSDIGGVWYTSDRPKPGNGPQMYDSLITNLSKSIMCFSDFPCPSHYPPYLPHRLFQQYLQSYVQHFQLRQYIQFNTKVLNVSKAEDYEATGRWIVTTCKMMGNEESEQRMSTEFDGVLLCHGFLRVPFTPSIPGLNETFPGKVHHAGRYKNPEPFCDRTVIVVGAATSAADVACDIAPVAKQVYLSLHRGTYAISRLDKGRMPTDFRRHYRAAATYLPTSLATRIFISDASKWLDPVTSGIKPKPSTPLAQISFMINDQLPFKIMTGQIKAVAYIERLTDTAEAHLEDGSILKEVDDIIFATGYRSDFSVIDPAFVSSDQKGERLELYKMTFPVSLPHDSLAVIGCLRISGPLPPFLEIQTRLAARVLAGRHKLPERTVMKRDIDQMNQQQLQTFGSFRYLFMYLPMADSVAAELGVKPNWWRFLLQGDLKMALAVLFGPAHPFHYRLTGPQQWEGARDATLNAYRETVFSTQHRRVWEEETVRQKGRGVPIAQVLRMLVFGIVVYLLWLCL